MLLATLILMLFLTDFSQGEAVAPSRLTSTVPQDDVQASRSQRGGKGVRRKGFVVSP